jgi:uncharacterized protein YacL
LSRRPVPSVVVEVLRLCVIIFFAGLGYEGAQLLAGSSHRDLLGGVDPLWVGLLLGIAFGFVIGGMVGRLTERTVSRTEQSLHDVSAEHIVAGVFGAIIGLVAGSAIAWPIFLIGDRLLAIPLFAFVLVTVVLFGYRVGAARRDGMLGLFGASAGMGPRPVATASLPRVVDTSVAIDGRIIDVVRAGFLGGQMLIAAPVLAELQGLADASDELRRGRGRRGLEILETLRREPSVEVVVIDDEVPAVAEVDAKLVRICLDRGVGLLTLDTNLAKSASLAGVKVMNLHALAMAMRPPVVAGDEVSVLLTKPGKESGQAIGYLDDGTMVVVERARDGIGSEARVLVTSVLTTANGRMVFARPQSIAGSRV